MSTASPLESRSPVASAEVNLADKQIAKYLAALMDQRPKATRLWDMTRERSVDILTATDCPQAGILLHATVGLSRDVTIGPTGVELITTCRSTFTEVHRGLAQAAFALRTSEETLHAGLILPATLPMYRCWSLLRHYLLAEPQHWEAELTPRAFEGREVQWLWAISITDAESDYAARHGGAALENLLAREGADLEDFNRVSVV